MSACTWSSSASATMSRCRRRRSPATSTRPCEGTAGIGHGAKSIRTSTVRSTAAPKGRGGEFLTPPMALSLPEAHSGPRRSPRGRIQPDHTDHPPVDCGLLTALPAWPWWRAAAADRGDDHAGSSWIGDRVGTSAGEKPDRLKESREYKPAGRHSGVGPRGGALLAAHGWPPEL